MTANVRQTDTVQRCLACEKCYKITGCYNNCVAAQEPLSYTDKSADKEFPVALNGGRMAVIALAPEARRDEEQEFFHSGHRQLAGRPMEIATLTRSQISAAGELTEGEPHRGAISTLPTPASPPSAGGGEVLANGRHVRIAATPAHAATDNGLRFASSF
jgi:hypothetical protein